MLILGIDTSTRQGSIALLRAPDPAPAAGAASGAAESHIRQQRADVGHPSAELHTVELASLGDGRASEVLVPAIAALLARHGVEKRSLSLIAVASGPGSFTGLRVALATAKGLAEAFAIPVVAVSVLEAVALAAGVEGRVVAAIDAQRGEMFFGEYIVHSRAAEAVEPAQRLREEIARVGDFTLALASAANALASGDPPLRVFTPDASLATRLREGAAFAVVLLPPPTAEDIARIAHRRFLAGERADVATLDANYLRRSDAEMVAAGRPGSVTEPGKIVLG